jgi:asparagine synthase (glutamine-hydrolysing)
MCGIAGWVSFERNLENERQSVEAMTRTMALRGPDAGGIWLAPHAGIGHRRLSVIDLEGGVQPMHVEEGNETLACLTYSGEIYNFVELRDELRALGQVFRTRSDTEVVLRAYLQWGEDFVTRLNGMFAFAIWDTRQEKLLLVRDRVGVKPLFYAPFGNGVLFGSEPKAILAHPEMHARVDLAGFRRVLQMANGGAHTIYSGISEVLPGQVVRVSSAGIQPRTYWRLEARPHEDDLDTTIATVRGLLEDIVQRQSVADVPVCTLLSGGLDSSLVTALAHRTLKDENGGARAFSVNFADHGKEFVGSEFHLTPDAPYARLLARALGLDYHEVVLDSAELATQEVRRAAVEACDSPLGVTNLYTSLYRLFGAIRASSTVALSGEAADELFGGYPWFHHPQAQDSGTYPWLSGGFGGTFERTAMLDPGLLQELDLPQYTAERYREDLASCPVLPGEPAEERQQRELFQLHQRQFLRMLLDRKDRLSMAVGLEVRVPFCDHRLVEYLFNVPWHMKSFDGREKSLLRAAARGVLPDEILDRRKSPYPSTEDPAYERVIRADLASIARDPDAPVSRFIDREAVRRFAEAPLPESTSLAALKGADFILTLNDWMECRDVELAL